MTVGEVAINIILVPGIGPIISSKGWCLSRSHRDKDNAVVIIATSSEGHYYKIIALH